MNGTQAHRLAASAVGLFVILAAASLLSVFEGRANASHAGGMDAMSIDLDIAGNTATTLGPRDDCLEVTPGQTIVFDVTAKNIPATNPMVGFQFTMRFPATSASITGHDSAFLLASEPGSMLVDPSGLDTSDENLWIGAAADITSEMAAPEDGSGVLQRIQMAIDPGASPGVYPLTLEDSGHIDQVNEAWVPDAINPGSLAIGAVCDSAPSPGLSPTFTVTPPPLPVVRLGIDHDGGAPDINSGPAVIPAGGSATIGIVVEPPPGQLAVWDVEAGATAITVLTECSPSPGSTCTVGSGLSGGVTITGSAPGGLAGAATLATLTLEAAAGASGCETWSVGAISLTDIHGQPLSSNLSIGYVCTTGAELPTANPASPTPTPTVTPPPLPAVADVGFDHNGGPPDINTGPAYVAAGATASVSVVSESAPNLINAVDATIKFDPGALEALGCTAPHGVCNAFAAPDEARLSVATLAGLPANATLMDITFVALGGGPVCTPVVITAISAADVIGAPIGVDTHQGVICIGDSPDAPPPTPTPTPIPPPFPSPTPGGTAAPTPPPGGAPPVFDPGGMLCLDNVETAVSCDGDSAPGASPDLTLNMCVGWGQDCQSPPVVPQVEDANFSAMVNFIPAEYRAASAAGVPVGAVAGYLAENAVLGLLNQPCSTQIQLSFSLIAGSTNQSEAIAGLAPGMPNRFEPLALDANSNGIPDGADHYPDFLVEYLGGVQPRERLFGVSKIQGGWVPYNVLFFDPGTSVPTSAGQVVAPDPALGLPVLVVLGDPTQPESPDVISDYCAPRRTWLSLFGKTFGNPCTPALPDNASKRAGNCPLPESGAANQSTQNSGYPSLPCEGLNSIDEDNDGWINDGCPHINDIAESGGQCANNTSDDGEDSSVNDGCPAVGDESELVRSGSCSGTDEEGCVVYTNPNNVGSEYVFTSLVVARWDADQDGIENQLDVCSTTQNPDWNPRTYDYVNDPDSDGLPSVCDPNPGSSSPLSPLACLAGIVGADEDQDCVSNRGDNCPDHNQLANPGAPPSETNLPYMLDSDGDDIGDVCDPDPVQRNGMMIGYCLRFAMAVGGESGPVSGINGGAAPNCAAPPAGVLPPPATPPPCACDPLPVQPTPTPSATALAAVQLPAAGGPSGSAQSTLWLIAAALIGIATAGAVALRGRFYR